jgi:signal transduction histidine kinase
MRINLKLTGWIALGITAVAAGYGYQYASTYIEAYEEDAVRDHHTVGYGLAQAMSAVSKRSGSTEALAILETADVLENRVSLEWIPDPSGAARELSPERIRSEVVPVDGDEHAVLVTRVPVSLADLGPGYLELRESLETEASHDEVTVHRTLGMVLLTILVCAAIVVTFGWIVVGRPVGKLVAKVRRIGEGDLASPPLALRRRDEIGELAAEIDGMCTRLAAADARAERESTARLAALEQLRHADRLATVGKLASGIAHEVGTPLNVMIARAQMIARGEAVGGEARDDARVVVEQGKRIAGIVRKLLDFSRARSNAAGSEDLRAVARRVVSLLEPLGVKHGVRLGLDEATEGPVLAAVDPGRLQQAIANLVMNAIQAQEGGGAVRLRVETDPQHNESVVAVEDDGPGIPQKIRDRIFEPFFTTKDVGEGTGLGLSVAYGIVREHGGRLDVESSAGGGARFVIRLPPGEPWARYPDAS